MHNLLLNLFKRFVSSRRGNVSMIFALTIIPATFAMGVAIDYSMAAKRRARMNAAADAAALSAVTPAMMQQTTAVAQARAKDIFNSQVSGLSGVIYNSDVQVTVSEQAINNLRTRTAKVIYNAKSVNAFGGILNLDAIPIGNGVSGPGATTASATAAANIDFYLMLDTSPSMAIAATQAGIDKMVANTPTQGGCAFACHQYNPAADKLGNPGGIDNYQLARNLSVTLRIDLVKQAVQNLMTSAQNDEVIYNAIYRMAGYTFDVAVNNVMPLTSNLTLAQSQAGNINMLEVWSNNNLTNGNPNNDQDTNFDKAFQTLNQAMPAPGFGSNTTGDKPQEVLFIVTDGVADMAWSGSRNYAPFGPTGPAWCTSIKKRNIRIAVLYTTYFPLPTNAWYNTYISGEQASISTVAQACASPGLFFEVNTGGDISAAMTTLFQAAVTSAHLTQ